jgi:hypothetical protein
MSFTKCSPAEQLFHPKIPDQSGIGLHLGFITEETKYHDFLDSVICRYVWVLRFNFLRNPLKQVMHLQISPCIVRRCCIAEFGLYHLNKVFPVEFDAEVFLDSKENIKQVDSHFPMARLSCLVHRKGRLRFPGNKFELADRWT